MMARQGIPFDAVAGVPRNDRAKEFARRRGVGWTFRANYATYKPDKLCGVLVRFWVAKMQFYFNLEQLDPLGKDLVFTNDHHAMFLEPSEVSRELGHPDVPQVFVRRVENIRVLFK